MMKATSTRTALLIIILFIACPVFAKNMTILVHPFQNTGDKKYSFYSAGMTDSVISENERKKAVSELALSQTVLVEEAKPVKVGKMLGANVIFTGSYFFTGNQIRVNAKLMDVEKGTIEKSVKIDGTLDKIFEFQDKIDFSLMAESEKIRIADIKPPVVTEEDRKHIENKQEPKLTAYELYAKGLEMQDTNPKGALELFKQAIKIDGAYVDALRAAGFTAGNTLNIFEEALAYLNKADMVLKKRGETKTFGYADLLMNIGIVYANKGDLDSALEYFTKSKTIQDSLGLQKTSGYANLLNNIGLVYKSKGDLDSAIEYYMKDKAIEDNLGLQKTSEYADLLNNIGIVYWSKGKLDSALEYFTKSKTIQDSLGLQKTSGYAALLNSIGLVYLSKGNLDSALEYFTKSKTIQDSLGLQKTADYATLLMNIGIVYDNKGDLDSALEYYTKSKTIRDSLGLQKTSDYATLLMNIGIVYKSKGDLDSAIEYYMKDKAIEDSLGLQKTSGYAFMLMNIGNVYKQQGKKTLAGQHYRKAYETFESAGYTGKAKEEARKYAEELGY